VRSALVIGTSVKPLWHTPMVAELGVKVIVIGTVVTDQRAAGIASTGARETRDLRGRPTSRGADSLAMVEGASRRDSPSWSSGRNVGGRGRLVGASAAAARSSRHPVPPLTSRHVRGRHASATRGGARPASRSDERATLLAGAAVLLPPRSSSPRGTVPGRLGRGSVVRPRP